MISWLCEICETKKKRKNNNSRMQIVFYRWRDKENWDKVKGGGEGREKGAVGTRWLENLTYAHAPILMSCSLPRERREGSPPREPFVFRTLTSCLSIIEARAREQTELPLPRCCYECCCPPARRATLPLFVPEQEPLTGATGGGDRLSDRDWTGANTSESIRVGV